MWLDIREFGIQMSVDDNLRLGGGMRRPLKSILVNVKWPSPQKAGAFLDALLDVQRQADDANAVSLCWFAVELDSEGLRQTNMMLRQDSARYSRDQHTTQERIQAVGFQVWRRQGETEREIRDCRFTVIPSVRSTPDAMYATDCSSSNDRTKRQNSRFSSRVVIGGYRRNL